MDLDGDSMAVLSVPTMCSRLNAPSAPRPLERLNRASSVRIALPLVAAAAPRHRVVPHPLCTIFKRSLSAGPAGRFWRNSRDLLNRDALRPSHSMF